MRLPTKCRELFHNNANFREVKEFVTRFKSGPALESFNKWLEIFYVEEFSKSYSSFSELQKETAQILKTIEAL